AMHAWAEVYLPGAGWKGFDPTNGILADHCYVPSAVSDEPANVDPVQGSFFAAGAVDSHMTVELIIEAME
ncbi:MAG: transglutaminase family protein, partial [Xanthomonadales bacterium]|nr:transglutaminase family protein [Xanthomonadales bacterium]